MKEYVGYAILLLINYVQFSTSTFVFGFDTSVCNYRSQSEGGPIPLWALGYSTNVEWKVLDKDIIVNVQEYSDPINKVRSINAAIQGVNIQIIINDKQQEYYTIVDTCKVTNLQSEMVFFPKIYNLEWLTMTKDWFTLMKLTHVKQMNSTKIRSIDVDHWSTCVYVLNNDITSQIDWYFAKKWTVPLVDPNVIIPVRVEVRGKINGTASTAFHVVGDFYNFSPSPPPDPLSLQPKPGVFCPNKFPGNGILNLPKNFYAIIEIIDREQHTIKFQEIWFHHDMKYIRYDTKATDNSDSDPYMTVLDFNTGIRYKVDKYIGTCERELVVVGDNFVRATTNYANDVSIVTAAEFFNLANPDQTQYVGKRWARNILCDVWVGIYFDYAVSRNFTAEWYFASQGWTEAVGLSLQSGSLIKMDIFAGGKYPTTHHIHRMDPIAPPLSSFDLNSCYKSNQKAHIIIRFSVSNGRLISEISQSYLQNKLQIELTKLANIGSTRMTEISTEYYGGSYFYFVATILDLPDRINPRVPKSSIPPVPLDVAVGGLKDQIGNGWAINITASTGQIVLFNGVNIVRLSFQEELKTTTVPTPPTVPIDTPPLPTSGSSSTTIVPTPPTPGPITTKTTKPTTKTTKTTAKTTQRKITTITPKPCICPKTTCPVITTQTPVPPANCPTLPPTTKAPIKQTTTKPTTAVPQTQTPKTVVPQTIKPNVISTQSDCSGIINNLKQHALKTKTSGVSSGGAVGLAVGMLILGALFGISFTKLYIWKFQKKPALLNDMDDNPHSL